jgi:hypothetical protein
MKERRYQAGRNLSAMEVRLPRNGVMTHEMPIFTSGVEVAASNISK